MRVDVNEENMRLFGEESCVRVVGGDCAFPNALCSGLVACTWLVAGGCGGVCMQKDSARGGTYYVVAQTLPLLMSRQLHEWSGEEVCAKESL